MKVLGINAIYHDPAAALVIDGKVVAAAEEERFSRRKHGKRPLPWSAWELPELSAAWCLKNAGLRPEELDAVGYSFDPALMGTPEDSGLFDDGDTMRKKYAETTDCRRQFLLGYFGEQLDEPCGNCDSDTCTGTAEQRAAAAEARAHTPFPVETPVEHTEWGNGVVMRVEDDRVVVLFDDVGYKTLGLAAVVENDLLRARTSA